MANPLQRLLGQTAIYGLPTIVGRLLNFFLVPLYTWKFAETSDYGVLSHLYAYVAFLMVFLTFGMETAFFKFLNDRNDKQETFQNSFLTVLGLNTIFLLVILLFSPSLADAMGYASNVEFIVILGLVVVTDAAAAIPLAKLRAENKAGKFAIIQSASIVTNIVLNLFIMFVLFNPEEPMEAIFFILLANLVASLVKVVGTYKDFLTIRLTYNAQLAKDMIRYSFPLMIGGLAGIANETLDRAIMRPVMEYSGSTSKEALSQLGIYSACYKLSIIVTILLQAYRYAAEPFFFSRAKEENANKLFAKIMNYFVAFLCIVFLGITLNIDTFKYFIPNEDYWVGLDVVPILLLANIFLGIYLNQSVWYKLSDQTRFGAYIAMGGAVLTIAINVIFIPLYGFRASAWATLIVYASQMVASYFLGQKYYPIRYNLRKFFLYLLLGLALFAIAWLSNVNPDRFTWRKFAFQNSLILFYGFVVWFIERPSSTPPKQKETTQRSTE